MRYYKNKKKASATVVIILIIAILVVVFSIVKEVTKTEEIIEEETQVARPVPPTPPAFEPAVTQTLPSISEVKTTVKEAEPDKSEVFVQIKRYEFDTPEITISSGTKVIWKNIDERRHVITNPDIGLFRTIRKALSKGDTFEYTFSEPGTYKIMEANFGIRGLVIVK